MSDAAKVRAELDRISDAYDGDDIGQVDMDDMAKLLALARAGVDLAETVEKVNSESAPYNPCPDVNLRAMYRKQQAVALDAFWEAAK